MKEWLDLYPPGRDTLKEKHIPAPKKRITTLGLKRAKQLAVQETLDLHGYLAEEAEKELLEFIKRSRKRKLRKLLVIHGKGLHSEEGSVLRPLVKRILEEHPLIMDFGRAEKNQGGSGATWFILKEKN